MICQFCGCGGVSWQGPITNLTHTLCPRCKAINCQVIETEEISDEDNEWMNASMGRYQPAPHSSAPDGKDEHDPSLGDEQ